MPLITNIFVSGTIIVPVTFLFRNRRTSLICLPAAAAVSLHNPGCPLADELKRGQLRVRWRAAALFGKLWHGGRFILCAAGSWQQEMLRVMKSNETTKNRDKEMFWLFEMKLLFLKYKMIENLAKFHES